MVSLSLTQSKHSDINIELNFTSLLFSLGVDVAGTYQIVLSSDDDIFGGYNRVDKSIKHVTTPEGFSGRRNYLQLYIPCRTAFIYAKVD